MVASTVKSSVDPTAAGQEDIVPPGIKTSKTGGRPEAMALSRSVEQSENQLEPHRHRRRLLIRRFAGSNYGTNYGMENPDPLNLIYSLVSTLVPALVVDPRATVMTVAGDLAFAETFRLAIDDESKKITLDKTIKSVIIDSLFGLGVIKTGLKAAPGFEDEGDLEIDSGTLFSERTSFTNYIIDMASNTRAKAQYEGDRYEITADFARSTGMFDERTIQLLLASTRLESGHTNDGSTRQGDDQFIDRLQLVDLFVPHEQRIVTVPGDVRFSNLGYLNQFKWTGDPSGPYDTIGFSPVPGKILPTSVIGVIYEMYVLVNKLARKIGRQADSQKTIAVFQKGREGDGDAVRDSNDGDMIGVDDVEGIQTLSFGGANDDGFKTIAWYQDFFNKIAGNPDLIGGIGEDAPTLGQDQMSLQSANGRLDDWRQTVLDTSASVLRKIAGYIWTDKDTRRNLMFKGGGFKFPRQFGKTRKGEFEDYELGIDATHRPPMSPDQKYLRKQRLITEVVIPLGDAAAAQGLAVDVNKTVKIMARDLGVENDFDEMFVPVEDIPRLQQQQAPAGAEQEPRLSQPARVAEGV